MNSAYRVSKRLDEVLDWKRQIATEVEQLPTKEALREIMRKSSEIRGRYPKLVERSPRSRRP